MSELLPQLKTRYLDDNGAPLVGGKLYSYAAGTSTPQATYTDESGGTPNTNPIILDGNGEADVWIGSLPYKFVLTDANDVQQFVVDNVLAAGAQTQAEAAAASAIAAASQAAASATSAAASAASAASVSNVITGTRGSPQLITASGGIAFVSGSPRNTWFIAGSSGAVIVTKNPQIAAGANVGDEFDLFATNDTNTVTLQDGNGLDMNGAWVGGNGGRIKFFWDGTLWSESYRR